MLITVGCHALAGTSTISARGATCPTMVGSAGAGQQGRSKQRASIGRTSWCAEAARPEARGFVQGATEGTSLSTNAGKPCHWNIQFFAVSRLPLTRSFLICILALPKRGFVSLWMRFDVESNSKVQSLLWCSSENEKRQGSLLCAVVLSNVRGGSLLCRFCCNVATFFCFGHTHFCDECHSRRPDRNPALVQPCRGARWCQLGVEHPPQGEEFCIGCGACRSTA